MLSADAQNIALDSMAAIPVIDYSLLDPELTKTIGDPEGRFLPYEQPWNSRNRVI